VVTDAPHPEFDVDPGLLVCVDAGRGGAYLPLSEYAPLIHQLEALQAQVNTLLAKMAAIARLARAT